MELVDRLRAWTYERQRLGRPARSAGETLRSVVAVYSVHPTAPLALAARTASFSAAAYRRLDTSRRALRIPAMRSTVFLVPRADAARIFTAAGVKPQIARRLKANDLTEARYGRIAAAVLKAAAEEPVRAEVLGEAAGIKGRALSAVVNNLREEGRLLSIGARGLRGGKLRHVATEAWIDEGLSSGDRGQALVWLAGTYLRGYGPARPADFAWWAGIPKRDAAAAFDAQATVEIEDGLVLPRRDEAAFGRVRRVRNRVDLLPKWDPYTMGHAPDGRARLVHPDVQKPVYTPVGIGLPGDGQRVVLVDGEAVGLWNLTVKDGFKVDPFERLTPKVRRSVYERAEDLARILDE